MEYAPDMLAQPIRTHDGTARRAMVVSLSHGEPATRLRTARAAELGRELRARGVKVDQLVLVERALSTADEKRFAALRSDSDSFAAIAASGGGLWARLLRLLGGGGKSRARLRHCPRAFTQAARALFLREHHDVVVLGSSRLLPLAVALRGISSEEERSTAHGEGEHVSPSVYLDLPALDGVVRQSNRRVGRQDADPVDGNVTPELLAHARVDACLVSCDADRRYLETAGFLTRSLVVPPLGSAVPIASTTPVRPPRLLFVGSETVANLDAVRWFRRRVLPRVHRLVPSCRLRIIGETGRFIEPGPDVERIGWVDDLDREYAEAALVVLPLRLGGRLRRRVIDAFASGRAVALTRPASHGLDLVHRDDAIVGDDESALAQGIVDVLRNDVLRRRLEERSCEIATNRADAGRMWSELLDHLGLSDAVFTPVERAVVDDVVRSQ